MACILWSAKTVQTNTVVKSGMRNEARALAAQSADTGGFPKMAREEMRKSSNKNRLGLGCGIRLVSSAVARAFTLAKTLSACLLTVLQC